MRDVHLRATRNCPWVGELWVRYLLCLERCRSSEAEMSAVRIMYLCISGLAYLISFELILGMRWLFLLLGIMIEICHLVI